MHRICRRTTANLRQSCRVARVQRWHAHRRSIAGHVCVTACCSSRARIVCAGHPARDCLGNRQWICGVTNEIYALSERNCFGKARNKNNCDGQNAPRGGVHHFLPPGPVTHHRPFSAARFLMAVNRKLPEGTVEPRSGTTVKDESWGANPPQTFLKCFWSATPSSELWCGERSPA